MKRIITSAIAGLVMGLPLGYSVRTNNDSSDSDKNLSIIKEAREAAFQLDLEYNRLYQIVGYSQVNQAFGEMSEEDEEYAYMYKAAFQCLQSLSPEIISLNKSLKIDCRIYKEDGKPVSIEFTPGKKDFLECVPKEFRIME